MIIVNIIILIIIIVFIIIYKTMDKFYFRNKYKKYKEKYLNLKYGSGHKNNYKNNIILIPHAGKKYSGDARKNVFNEIKHEITHIFYIAALHNMGEAKKQFGEEVYVQKDSKNIFRNDIFIKELNDEQKNIIEKEHSFKWVEEELNEHFNNPKITVIYPTENSDLDKIVNVLSTICNNKEYLIVGTSDFIHYGKNYGLNNWKNPHNEKILLEGPFIKNICHNNHNKVHKLHEENNHLCCGFTSIKTIMKLSEKCKRIGNVVDYYDSYQSDFDDIRKYSLSDDVKMYVSYASIMFASEKKSNLSNLDIKLGLGAVRSIINSTINKKKLSDRYIYYTFFKKYIKDKFNLSPQHFIPTFSHWWNMENGIFVGTTYNNKTNSSYGNYQEEGKSSAISLFNASQKCYEDSLNRWKKPITKDIESNKYKIEILDDKKIWEEIDANKLKSSHYKLGLYLTINFNNISYSATYLPGVWKEHFSDNPKEVLNSLTEKATNYKYKWNNSPTAKIKLYGSEKYLSSEIFID
jgi:AmmeMemoRadiSam system protein B